MEKKVLFVDDEELILKVLEKMFSVHGFHPLCTTSGHEALDIVTREDVRVFFLDLRMPEMDGMELCRRIKKLQPASCVYALSAFVDAFTPRQFAEAGFEGRFRKPFKMDMLLDACRQAFDRLERQSQGQGEAQQAEHRKHARISCEEKVFGLIIGCNESPDLIGNRFNCTTRNISAGGLQIWTDRSIPVGTVLDLHVGMGERATTLCLNGKVKWVMKTDSEIFQVGIEFSDSSPDFRAWLNFVDEMIGTK